MGACRHIAGMRTIHEESRTVADNASGSVHSLVPPTSRNKSPVAQPRSALKMRPQKLVTACFICGSSAGIIALIAQIGLVSAPSRSSNQSAVVAIKKFTAR
jgi:hypothetical protein